MGRWTKPSKAWLLPALMLASASPAHALQTIDARDGVSVEAVLSMKEPTRIRIDSAAITNVFGNIYSSNCGEAASAPHGAPASMPPGAPGGAPGAAAAPAVNLAGEIVIECDTDKGEIYVRPVSVASKPAGQKPVNLFVSSANATYTLLLRPADTPADTILIRDRSARVAAGGERDDSFAATSNQHIRALKGMLVAMQSHTPPPDVRLQAVNRQVDLWREARFTLLKLYEGRNLLGEVYALQNVSNDDMVLAEQEFDREGDSVLGVAVEHHNLRPGEATTVYVIRRGT